MLEMTFVDLAPVFPTVCAKKKTVTGRMLPCVFSLARTLNNATTSGRLYFSVANIKLTPSLKVFRKLAEIGTN